MKINQAFLALLVAAFAASCSKQMPIVAAYKTPDAPTVAEARAEARKFAGFSRDGVFHMQNTNSTATDATLQWQWAHTINGKQATWLRVPITLPIKDAPFSSMAMLFTKLNSGQVQTWLTTENLVRLNDTLRRAVSFYTPNGKLNHTVLLRDDQKKMYKIQIPAAAPLNTDRRMGGCSMTGFTVITVKCKRRYKCAVTAHTNLRIDCRHINPDAEEGLTCFYGDQNSGGVDPVPKEP